MRDVHLTNKCRDRSGAGTYCRAPGCGWPEDSEGGLGARGSAHSGALLGGKAAPRRRWRRLLR